MRESSYYADISRYYRKNATGSMAWEAKFSRTKYINFKCLAPHQEEKLLEAERVYAGKIEDTGVSRKPFDGFVLHRVRSVFIAIYYTPRSTEVYEIPIRSFLKEKYTSGEKSLSIDKAREIASAKMNI